MDFEREAEVARDAARKAGDVIAKHAAGERKSWDKAEDSPVTQADLEANGIICDALASAFPDDAILSEETRDRRDRLEAERVWIVDPLDGTKEFIEGVPQYAVSIALAERGVPVVGVVYQPITHECFWGAQGLGSWLEDTQLAVSKAEKLEDCAVLSSRTEMKRGQMEPYSDWFAELRPVGSVALKLALVAAGRADVWISAAPKSEWDVCGGDLLVREAGGVFVAVDTGPRVYNREDVLLQPLLAAGPPHLVEAIRTRSRVQSQAKSQERSNDA